MTFELSDRTKFAIIFVFGCFVITDFYPSWRDTFGYGLIFVGVYTLLEGWFISHLNKDKVKDV